MAKKEKDKSIIMRVLTNAYVKNLALMALITGVIIALTLYGLKIYTKHGESVTVPSVIGMQEHEAASILRQHSLGYEVVDSIFLTGGKPGGMTDQVPEEGSLVKKDRIIFLTMQAKGVDKVAIPALKDYSQRQAVATLHSLGFTNIIVKEVPSAYRGLVLDVTYRGNSIEPNAKLPKGDPIGLTIGAGGEVLIDSLIDILPQIDPQNSNVQSQDNPVIDNSFFE